MPAQITTGLYMRARRGLRLRDKAVERPARRMRQCMPWLEDADMPTARAWAQIEYLCAMVYVDLSNKGALNAQGEGRRLLDDYRKLRTTQIALARELGMTPLSRSQLRGS